MHGINVCLSLTRARDDANDLRSMSDELGHAQPYTSYSVSKPDRKRQEIHAAFHLLMDKALCPHVCLGHMD